jgi:hypothetical protein
VEVGNAVLNGERLPKPKKCPQELYDLMLKCWNARPAERPTFRELLSELTEFAKAFQQEPKSIQTHILEECDVLSFFSSNSRT